MTDSDRRREEFVRQLRAVGRIARWEVRRGASVIDRRTAVIGLLVVLLGGGVVGAVAVAGPDGVAIDRDIYRVGIDTENPYYPVVRESSQLDASEPDPQLLADGDIELLVDDIGTNQIVLYTADSEKGDAAHAALLTAIERHTERAMAAEPNETAAYPVLVELQYVTRPIDSPDGVDATDGLADESDDAVRDEGPADPATDETGGEGVDHDADRETTADPRGETDDSADGSGSGSGGVIPSIGTGVLGGTTSGSPAAIQPPFPFSSLLLAFVFLVPMNFVIQAYGSTILNERIDRRGELLLVAPISPVAIIVGKTLPYFVGGLGVTAVIAAGVGGGVLSVLAVVPIVFAFLSATFLSGMLARSFKELTFVTVTISVFLTTYVFVPAIFTNVTPIALISPLSIVVLDLQGELVSVGEYAFATAPFYVGSVVLFALGAGIYREEDMFTQKPVPAKFIDALDAQLSGYRSVAFLTALFVPFVFVAELLAIAVLFVAPIELSVPVLLVSIALIEEVAKSVHVYAGYRRNRFDRAVPVAIAIGIAAGTGFFVAEKFTAIAQVVGLPDLALGQAAFTPAGITPTLAIGLFFAPLALHVVTASITALGARDSKLVYASAVFVATVVHAGYNFAVVTTYA
ncbi:MAG: PrsW family intramembrane metalloprotease [Halobacteriota archaeon]